MESNVQRKAKLILAGLAAMPAIGMASGNVNQTQANNYGSPYAENDTLPGEVEQVTGLTTQELSEAKSLVAELNKLDVVTVKNFNLTKAPRIPYQYNMPGQGSVSEARIQNLDRLAKLRSMIEAAK